MFRGACSLRCAVALLAAVFACAAAVPPEGVRWNADGGRVQMHVEDWPLERVLTTVATETGWRVRVEPGLERRVTLRFDGRPAGEALKLIAGDCSYSLVTEPGAAPLLLVFRTDATKATRQIAAGRLPRAAAGTRAAVIPNQLIVTLKTNVSPEAAAESGNSS